MNYNQGVKNETSFGDPVRLVQLTAFLWVGYLATLAIIDQSFWDPRHGNSQIFFYSLLGFVALLCLGLAYWRWAQERLGKVFIPVVIAIITIMPLIATWATITFFPRNSGLSPESMVLRLLPFLLVGFLLVAWQYKWQYMLLIILGIAALNFGIIWSSPTPESPSFLQAFAVPLIQAVVFLAVGLTISYLMSRLRKQQQSLEAANVRLTHYASTLEQLTTTRERNRLARELHDTLAHSLSGLSVQLETIKAYWDIDQEMARSSLDRSLAVAHAGLEETRRALQALRATPLEDLGLALALETMVRDASARANLALDLTITDRVPSLSPDVEQCIYRVAQEAVTNVVNHAKANNLTVRLEFTGGKVALIVRDDGIGFDVKKSDKTSHFGLTGMRERAQLVGGRLTVISKLGNGTTIELII